MIDVIAKMIYESWKDIPGYKPWVESGNSLKQDEARSLAAKIINKDHKLIDEMAVAIETLWDRCKQEYPISILEKITKEHPIIDEIEEFGVNGPVGLGIRKYGGHAV